MKKLIFRQALELIGDIKRGAVIWQLSNGRWIAIEWPIGADGIKPRSAEQEIDEATLEQKTRALYAVDAEKK